MALAKAFPATYMFDLHEPTSVSELLIPAMKAIACCLRF